MTAYSSKCFRRSPESVSFQLSVFALASFKMGNVGVGVSPECEPGFSARDQPMARETYVARTARRLAVFWAKSEKTHLRRHLRLWPRRELLATLATTVFAVDLDGAGVKSVIQQFQQRTGGADFRDNHLIPEFQEPAALSKWKFVKVITSSEMAWGYTKQTIDVTGKDGIRRLLGGFAGFECKAAWAIGRE